jgi:hypothetical protein
MPQATTIEQVTSIEIDFYEHEIYACQKLIARIIYDHRDFVTQPWVVMVNGEEVFRAIAPMKCHDFVTWHYKQGSLPVQKATTENEIMCEIAEACEQFGFELLDDGIYKDDQKLGQVGCTGGRWWVLSASSIDQQKVPCDSAFDALWTLLDVELISSFGEPCDCGGLTDEEFYRLEGPDYEELLDLPFDQLNEWQWLRLMETEEEVQELAAV